MRVLHLIRWLSLGAFVLTLLGWVVASILVWMTEANLPQGPFLTQYPVLTTPPAEGWEEAVERLDACHSVQAVCSAVGAIALAIHLVLVNLVLQRIGRKPAGGEPPPIRMSLRAICLCC